MYSHLTDLSSYSDQNINQNINDNELNKNMNKLWAVIPLQIS